MAINLTKGIIATLLNGGNIDDTKPILQITDVRLVNSSSQAQERYRLVLSDGAHLQQGMLARQNNDLIHSQTLQKGSIIQLMQFVVNVIQGRMIIIILDLNVILSKCDPIGQPKVNNASPKATIELWTAEAKGRNLTPPIPSDMQSILKRFENLEKEVRSLKVNLAFMNRKDSEQTKLIEELQKNNDELSEEKERLLEEIERFL